MLINSLEDPAGEGYAEVSGGAAEKVGKLGRDQFVESASGIQSRQYVLPCSAPKRHENVGERRFAFPCVPGPVGELHMLMTFQVEPQDAVHHTTIRKNFVSHCLLKKAVHVVLFKS